MRELYEFSQYKETSSCWRLDLVKLLSEIVHKYFLKVAAELHGFFPDELETLIEFCDNILRHECTRLEGFLDLGIVSKPAEFVVDGSGFFSASTYMAKERQKCLFWGLSWHEFLLGRN